MEKPIIKQKRTLIGHFNLSRYHARGTKPDRMHGFFGIDIGPLEILEELEGGWVIIKSVSYHLRVGITMNRVTQTIYYLVHIPDRDVSNKYYIKGRVVEAWAGEFGKQWKAGLQVMRDFVTTKNAPK